LLEAEFFTYSTPFGNLLQKEEGQPVQWLAFGVWEGAVDGSPTQLVLTGNIGGCKFRIMLHL
jgi:hypothetical protein